MLSHCTGVRQFWEKWDALALERKCILDKKRLTQAGFAEVDDSYRHTNKSLIDCPCRGFPALRVLQKLTARRAYYPTCAAYAILGRFPTYVGQVGAKAKLKKRLPMRRQRENFRKAKQLQGQYMGRTARNLRETHFLENVRASPDYLRATAPMHAP